MRALLLGLLVASLAAPTLAACGGEIGGEPGGDGGPPAQPADRGPTDPGAPDDGDGGDGGTCPAGYAPIECNGVLLYCCAPGAHCAPPSCNVPAPLDASAPDDAGSCPPGEYLLVPCCGGYNDTSCSNGPGPPAPFCTKLPASCDGQSSCDVGGCSGRLDESTRSLQCVCI